MPEPTTNPAAETAQPLPVVEGQGTQPPAADATPASEPPVEEWDKERAAATIKAQREQEKALKNQLKDYERLKADEQKRLDAQLSETERLQKQATEAAAQVAKLQADILRRDVVSETGLPPIFADRLKGATKDEMLADAKEILKVLPQQPKTPPRVPPTNPDNGNPNETDAQKRERLFGRQGNIFDMASIRDNGGGVVWTNPPEK